MSNSYLELNSPASAGGVVSVNKYLVVPDPLVIHRLAKLKERR